MNYVLSYDLGTGGIKASIFDQAGNSVASSFASCETYYPQTDFREQKPESWWELVVKSTRDLMVNTNISSKKISALGVSGHSLGVVPIGKAGELLAANVPIWSDARAKKQADDFFSRVDEPLWYEKTGNGFPAHLYSIFKILWFKKNAPEVFKQAVKWIGTKDYINYKLTGVIATDYSYASGSGVFDLNKWDYNQTLIEQAGIKRDILPDLYPSTHVLGTLNSEASRLLGIPSAVKVVSGGVDNACMAAGAGCIENGMAYTSLGSSSWIAVSSHQPIIDNKNRPYVFTHIIPDMFVSSTAIFSAGSSYRWVRDTLCQDLVLAEESGGEDAYIAMDRLAAASPPGAHKVMFNPSLAGGSHLDGTPHIRGAFVGLDLSHNRGDLIRSALEGICLNLRMAMDILESYVDLSENMLIVGGGGKSHFWRRIFADIYNKQIIETQVGEDAGSLGAAAAAAVGCGLWVDFKPLLKIHKTKDVLVPDSQVSAQYEKYLDVFRKVAHHQSAIGDLFSSL